jgi:hypothetical protein
MQNMLRCRCDRLCWDVVQVVICHSPEVTTDGRNIVGLGRVGHSVILIKTNALRRELIEGRLKGGHSQEEGRGSNAMVTHGRVCR